MRTVVYQGVRVTPSKIICIGRNYAAHAHELGNTVPDEMVVFLKPNSAIGDELKAFDGEALHYETELAFMIKNGVFNAVGVGLDLTKRALQTQLKAKALPWERAKAFDGAALFSAFVPLPDDLNALGIALDVNGKQRQRGSADQMLFSPEAILNNIKAFMSVEDGDIVMTGTPSGVGVIQPNDVFECAVYHRQQRLVGVQWYAK